MDFAYADYEKNGPEICGIRFVPLSIPLHRRWQMLCLSFYYFISVGMIPFLVPMFAVVVYLFLYTNFRYVIILYICWYIYDRNTPFIGGRSSCWLRRLLPAARKYYPAELVKTADLPVGANYLFGAFPHGIICQGLMANFIVDVRFREQFPGLDCHVMTLGTFFKIPVLREAFLLTGVSASTKENIMLHLMSEKKNKAVVLVIGGAAESTLTQFGKSTIVINNRKGFVKLALQSGSHLVPVYTFGENEVLGQYQGEKAVKFLNVIRKYTGIPPILVKGRGFFQYTFGFIPHRLPLNTIVGKPIPVPKIDNPTNDQIEEYHKKFKEGLIELFESNKEKYHIYGKKAELVCL